MVWIADLVKEKELDLKLRICICTNVWLGLYHGGVDRIVEFAKALSRHGANVFLVDRSTRRSLSALVIDNDEYFEVEDGRLKGIQYPLHIRFLFPGVIKFLQAAFNMLFGLLTHTTLSEANSFYAVDPYLIVKLLFVCRREKIDLIQCEFPFTTVSSLVVKKITGVPTVYDAHNIESDRLKSMREVSSIYAAVVRQLELTSCELCDSVFVVSKGDRQTMLSWNIPSEKIHLIPNSVDLTKFSPLVDGSEVRRRHNLDDAFVVIFHGFLSYPPNEEAARLLIRNMLPRILERHPNVYLLLVGRNPPQLSHPNVISTGFVESVAEYLAAADLAVVPLMHGGGTKLKMLEYMASGKAIVSTFKAAEGLDLENEIDLLMTKYPDSIFDQLVLRCIEDENLRKSLAVNARRKAEYLYDWELNAEKAICVYQDLLKLRRSDK
jgi:glycosyltransferase involved in cell wall biosynthesis